MIQSLKITNAWKILLIAAGHILLTAWALRLQAPPENISVMWLPDGYLLACLVLLPRPLWLPLCLCITGSSVFLEHLSVARPLGMILAFQVANLLESVGGALLFLYFGKGHKLFTGYRHLTFFLIFVVILLPSISAFIGAGSIALYNQTEQFWMVYRTWLFSAGLGNLFVAPLVLYLFFAFRYYVGIKKERQTSHEAVSGLSPVIDRTLLLIIILALAIVLLSSLPAIDDHAKAILTFFTLPLLMWSSIRYGMSGASVISSIVAISSVQLMALGNSVFINAHTSLSSAVLELQSYLGVSIVASFFTAISAEKNKRNIQALTDISEEFKGSLEHMPISLWIEDFSEARLYLDRMLSESRADIRHWLESNPHELKKLASMVRVISVNKASLDLYNADNKEQLFGNLNQIFNDDSLNVFREELISLYQSGERFSAETTQLTLDGTTIYTQVNVMTMPGCNETWDRVLVAIEDISARKKAENAIDHFFDQPMNLHIIARFDGSILRVNQGWKTALGYSREYLEGKSFLELVHPDDITPTIEKMQGLSQGETVYYFENRYQHQEKGFRWLAWSAVASVEEGLIYAVANDITDRKEAEISLRDSDEIFRNTGEGIILTEKDGTIRDVNPAFTDITGYGWSEVQGKHIRLLQSGRHDKAFYQKMWETIACTGNWQGEIWNRKKDGSIYPEYLTISAIRSENGEITRYVGVFSDITHIKHSEAQLFHLSTHDALTDLPNRTLLTEHIDRALKHAVRRGKKLAILLIDIDGFKHINDSLGPEAGDSLLQLFALRLKNSVRSDDTVARISGDEFVVVYEDLGQLNELTRMVENLMTQLSPVFSVSNKSLTLTVSIGVSVYPEDGNKSDLLLRNADAAMFRAKENGRNNYQFYTEELTASAFEHMFIESSLRYALNHGEFRLVYQPQINFKDGSLVGFEALLRWHSESRGLIPPGRFIPIAEQSGFMREIGNWVLLEACKQGKHWLDMGVDPGRIAVNVAGPQIKHGDLVQQVYYALEASGLPAHHLELEVTENFVMTEMNETIAQLQELLDMGIEIAIDDFGTGYSSLSYLKKLPINKLKIDQSFVREVHQSGSDRAIAEAIIAMANALNLKTIAEGVETEEQAALLTSKGCQQAQGYLYAKPITPEEVEQKYFHHHK